MSHSLLDNDPRKFSAITPKNLSSSYPRLLDKSLGTNEGVVPYWRNKQDVNCVIDKTIMRIFYKYGYVVMTDRGRRFAATGAKQTIKCKLCMKERTKILRHIYTDKGSIIDSNHKIYRACRHKTDLHRYKGEDLYRDVVATAQ